ncbi:MAG: transcription elongation factor GreA, transcription elongation factor GreA [Candidatus Parcubacteria bacterium]|jgi:transcription elongation factor GreA
MRMPKRKSEENARANKEVDNYLSPEAIRKLKDDLRRLEDVSRPRAVTDLSRARDMGDLSENAAYSEAKGRLMGMDRRIFEIKEKLKNAVVIERGSDDGRVAVGATVTVRVNGKEKSYEIVGSAETDPSGGRISHLSPLGTALLGRAAGDETTVKNAEGREVRYEIVEVH